MSDQDETPRDPNPADGDEQPTPVRSGPVVAGALAGFVGSWFLLAMIGVGTNKGTSLWYAALVILVLSVLLLAQPRTRQAGAGIVIGLTTGAVVGSGVCAALVGTGPVLG